MRRLSPIPSLAVLLLAACNFDAPKQYLVPDVRILAVASQVQPTISSAADPELGETLQLDALVANPRNRAAPVLSWFACNPPTLEEPLNPCLREEWLRDPDRFETATAADHVYRIPGATETVSLNLAPPAPGDPADPAREGLLAAAATALTQKLWLATPSAENPDARPDCELFATLPLVIVARTEGVTEVALKRVRITPTALLRASFPTAKDYYLLNNNPGVGAVQANPTDLDKCTGGTPVDSTCAGPIDCNGGVCGADGYCVLPTGNLTLCARASTTLQQPWQCPADGPPYLEDETLEWQWYVSAGTIAGTGFDGNAVADDIDLQPPSGQFTLWAILRDGRGGTRWVLRTLDPP
jgi:hypothetical protein